VPVLQDGAARALLAEALAGIDRLVLLGDTLELRAGSLAGTLSVAQPVLTELGAALGPDAEVVLVPGNHDHRLLRPWRERAAAESYEAVLGPMYAWVDGVAEVGAGTGLGLQGRVWSGLQRGRRRRSWRQRGMALGLPLAVAALNRAGLGPLKSDLSGPELRRA